MPSTLFDSDSVPATRHIAGGAVPSPDHGVRPARMSVPGLSYACASALVVMMLMLLRPDLASAADSYWLEDPISGCMVWSPDAPGDDEAISWSGGCVDGKAEGEGVLAWFAQGTLAGRYQGPMIAGMANGNGTLYMVDNKVGSGYLRVEGQFSQSFIDGYVRVTEADGGSFEGRIDELTMNGEGIWRSADGGMYEGPLEAGKPNGEGYAELADGTRYRGTFVDGLASGNGEMIDAEGNYYQGEFEDDHFHGQGRMEYADGATYVGSFRTGELDGQGTYTSPEGIRYQGRFVAGRPDGTVAVTSVDGSVTQETWSEGERVKQ